MPSGIKSADVDFDDLFDPDIVGDGPVANGLAQNGTALRYANVIYGARRADVGIKDAGTDVAAKWATKGTAVYVDLSGIPPGLGFEGSAPAGSQMQGRCGYTFSRNGAASWFDGAQGNGTWARGTESTGDAYDIRFTQTASNGRGTFEGSLDTWMQVNQARSFALELSYRGAAGSSTATRGIQIDVRRRSDGEIVATKTVDLSIYLEVNN